MSASDSTLQELPLARVHYTVRSSIRRGGSIRDRLNDLRAECARLASASDDELLLRAELKPVLTAAHEDAAWLALSEAVKAQRLDSWKTLLPEAATVPMAA